MAFIRGANVVTDGLVLALDAANPKSYVSGSTIWRDLSGTGVTGSLVNGPSFNSANGGSIVFDGVDDSVTFGNLQNLSLVESGTVEVWVYINGNWPSLMFPNLISKGASSGFDTDGWSLFVFAPQSTYRIGIGLRNNSSGASPTSVTCETNWQPFQNLWTHIVGTWDGSNIRLYVNGVQVRTVFQGRNGVQIKPAENNSSFLIAKGTSLSDFFLGQLSMNRIYNRALSPTEILQNYNATKARFGIQ